MGSSHSKPVKMATRIVNNTAKYHNTKPKAPAKPNFVAKRCNAFLAAPSFGWPVYLGPRDIEMQKVSCCCVCRRKINKEVDDIVIHNVHGCEAVYHVHCMRKWLERNFIDRRGREMRPHCYLCQNTMNIRIGQGRTRQNPLGFYGFPRTTRPAEVSGWY